MKLMAKGNQGGNPELLVAAAELKKKEAIEKTEKAIAKLSSRGEEITFRSIAQHAGVSVSYLYKYEELKDRIKHLREQQKQKTVIPAQEKRYQPASDKSKGVLIYSIKEENKKLRSEIEGLRRHIEVVQGRNYELSRVEEDNIRLKKSLELISQELEDCRCQIKASTITNTKVTSLDKKTGNRAPTISEQIKSKLSELGVTLNTTLTKTIQSKSEEMVLAAIKSLEETIERGQQIKNPGGWLNKAIQDGWMPSEKHLPLSKVERDIFNEWFNLARKQRLVMASTKGDDGQLIVYTTRGIPVPFKQMLAEYPIETLKQKK
jgi:AcrR family transcriptional regulator